MSAMVRTFRARDARGALAAVKAAMGVDAVILSTQQVGGGLFRDPEVEVTAALEPAPTPTPAPAHGVARYGAPVAQPPAPPAVGEELLALRSAIEGLRVQLREQPPEPKVNLLHAHLCQRGIDPALAHELLRVAALSHGPQPKAQWEGVRALLAGRLVPAPAPWLPGPHRVIALVGPTGVGKTTTLAKIAARAVLVARRKVALITLDTYRVGAADQVARYGALMNVPTRVAANPEQLRRALEQSADAELVLIDTTGRSRADEILAQGAMLRSVPGIERYLCLSAATGARELAAAARRFVPLEPSRLIFTKRDEAVGPGAIFSALASVPRPIACITDGQRVPEDIHAVNGAQLMELVAGTFKTN